MDKWSIHFRGRSELGDHERWNFIGIPFISSISSFWLEGWTEDCTFHFLFSLNFIEFGLYLKIVCENSAIDYDWLPFIGSFEQIYQGDYGLKFHKLWIIMSRLIFRTRMIKVLGRPGGTEISVVRFQNEKQSSRLESEWTFLDGHGSIGPNTKT